jgi:hypothetical protein
MPDGSGILMDVIEGVAAGWENRVTLGHVGSFLGLETPAGSPSVVRADRR